MTSYDKLAHHSSFTFSCCLVSCDCHCVVLDESDCSQLFAKLFQDDDCVNQLGLCLVETELRLVFTQGTAHHLRRAEQVALAGKDLLLQVGNLGGHLFGLAQDSPQRAVQGPGLLFNQGNGRVQQILVHVGVGQLGQFGNDGCQLKKRKKYKFKIQVFEFFSVKWQPN